ncbi:Yip1 family protein [Streptomyces sp. JJ36]|uniref:Yip1 family protein n=1 Tax=Streptomyces sp. JJ36 TaxID=2736645 RepID=UPI001F487D7F|nr:Yip1 family protein [Streptomyces sp. JJ36]MCF6525575.1 YIP1 family protein [Streptomyces sp. JJ36]
MAGFRIGRGRDSRTAQQHGQHPPQPPQGGPAGPPQGPPPGPYGPGTAHPPQGWPHGGGAQGEPEYLGDPAGGPGGGPYAGGRRPDPYANNPGHTQAFSIHDDPAAGGWSGDYTDGSTYSAGHAPGPPPGPRLHWKELLRGIVLRPNATFLRMRDHPVWGPALVVTFLYGLLAVFGLDETREDVLNATLPTALQYVIGTGIAMVLMGVVLGAVTHTLARQFGGDGAWAPTIGLSMLVMSLTDAPRLLFAMFLGGTAPLVQVLGWVTWVVAGALFTSMVSRSHDLHWPRALGASALQLLALLALIKLGAL